VSKSIVVQSVLYQNEPKAIRLAVEATTHALKYAHERAVIGDWTIVFGDCFPDGTLSPEFVAELAAYVGQAGGTFLFESFGENIGHGGGHNRLAKQTNSDLIHILNPDVVLAYDAISELVQKMDESTGAADGRQLPLEHPKDYDLETGSQSWASGACLLTRRSVFEVVGGFDHQTFFMYCDDVDYSWRVRLAGFRVVFVPQARAFHDKRLLVEGGIVAGEAERYYSAEAAVLLAYKYSRHRLVKKLLAQFTRDGSDISLRVLEEFSRRQKNSELPTQLDRARKVSYFKRGNYALHRY
jgi:GT2 family glycosyltransferase